jgi:hypothetical protein
LKLFASAESDQLAISTGGTSNVFRSALNEVKKFGSNRGPSTRISEENAQAKASPFR